MKILFKSIITAVCLLLTISAFGRGPFDRSVSEPEVSVPESEASLRDIYLSLWRDHLQDKQRKQERQKERLIIQDALKGLEYLDADLDSEDFTGKVEWDKDKGLVYLHFTQYVCQYKEEDMKGNASLSCLSKEDVSFFFFADSSPKPCFSCD